MFIFVIFRLVQCLCDQSKVLFVYNITIVQFIFTWHGTNFNSMSLGVKEDCGNVVKLVSCNTKNIIENILTFLIVANTNIFKMWIEKWSVIYLDNLLSGSVVHRFLSKGILTYQLFWQLVASMIICNLLM
jgi:hypothetical protein